MSAMNRVNRLLAQVAPAAEAPITGVVARTVAYTKKPVKVRETLRAHTAPPCSLMAVVCLIRDVRGPNSDHHRTKRKLEDSLDAAFQHTMRAHSIRSRS